jgi:predicted lipid carrier protein YhbT
MACHACRDWRDAGQRNKRLNPEGHEMFKLTVLPQPDVFLRLLPGFAQARMLDQLVNKTFDGQALGQLQPLAEKTLLFCTPGGELALVMRIGRDRIHVTAAAAESPDVTIRGDLMALKALCLGLEDSDSLFFSRRLLMTGDTAVGLMFKNILTNLDFDLRVELTNRFGEHTADRLWSMGQQASKAVEFADRRLADASLAIGQRFGLSSNEKIKVLETELHRLNKECNRLKRGSERRLRPVAGQAAS